jgi:hypothetical protein
VVQEVDTDDEIRRINVEESVVRKLELERSNRYFEQSFATQFECESDFRRKKLQEFYSSVTNPAELINESDKNKTEPGRVLSEYYDIFLNRRHTLLIVNINLGQYSLSSSSSELSKSQKTQPTPSFIRVRKGDDIPTLCATFCETHNLPGKIGTLLTTYVKKGTK